jgi:hypothetical protein
MGMSPIWNIDKSLPKPIWGSPFQYGDWDFLSFFSHAQDHLFLPKIMAIPTPEKDDADK